MGGTIQLLYVSGTDGLMRKRWGENPFLQVKSAFLNWPAYFSSEHPFRGEGDFRICGRGKGPLL